MMHRYQPRGDYGRMNHFRMTRNHYYPLLLIAGQAVVLCVCVYFGYNNVRKKRVLENLLVERSTVSIQYLHCKK